MKTRSVLLAAILTAALASTPSFAATVVYSALLTGANEAPPVPSAGMGFTAVSLDDATKLLTISVTFANLNANTTDAHIHCCTSVPGTGTVGVAIPTTAFPLGTTFGNYSKTFDLNLASSYSAAFLLNNGNTPASAYAALVAGLNSGSSYFNIHTTSSPGGEIRGFLHGPTAVPLPAAAWLLMGGVGMLGALARRRRVPA